MIIGCCTELRYYDQLAAAGYESINLPAKVLADWDEAELEYAYQKLKNGPLKTISLNMFCPPELKLAGPGYDGEKLRRHMEKIAAKGSRLGFRYVGIGGPASRCLLPGEDPATHMAQFCDCLRILCEVAEAYGMEILVEPVCRVEGNFLTTIREGLALVRELQLPNLHLVYDIYHEYMENQPLSVIEEALEEIRVVHIAQPVGNARGYLDAEQLELYRPYWDALTAAGYQGEWSIEAFLGDPAEEFGKSMQVIEQLKQ